MKKARGAPENPPTPPSEVTAFPAPILTAQYHSTDTFPAFPPPPRRPPSRPVGKCRSITRPPRCRLCPSTRARPPPPPPIYLSSRLSLVTLTVVCRLCVHLLRFVCYFIRGRIGDRGEGPYTKVNEKISTPHTSLTTQEYSRPTVAPRAVAHWPLERDPSCAGRTQVTSTPPPP